MRQGTDAASGARRKGPERIETARLVLRKPISADAEAIFSRYASDPEVTRFLSWPRHRSIEETRSFLMSSDAEWLRWSAGPYLIESRAGQQLLGGTGLHFETPTLAVTGYVLARDAWGHGYATEALGAIVAVARASGVRRLHAVCHSGHRASAHVLEKCGFLCESLLPRHLEFPNLTPGQAEDCLRYSRTFDE
jgi:ribosomal-protein-alanine N-acetyltransferase